MVTVNCLAVGEFQVNCYIVQGTDGKALVVDPGGDAERISAFLNEKGLTPAAYILTHAHMDHVYALAELCRDFPAPYVLHNADLEWIFSDLNQMQPFYGVPEKPSSSSPVTVREGDIIEYAGISLKVIETPGHTSGSVCYLIESDDILITGDTLFAGSAGRTDLPGGSSRQLSESLAKLKLLDDSLTVYPGHGPSSTVGYEKKTNFFMN